MAYLTAAQVRTYRPDRLNNTADSVLTGWVAVFEDIAERYLGVAYQSRTGVTYTGYPSNGWLELPHRRVSSVTVVDSDANSVTVEETDSLRGRVLVYRADSAKLTATYTHGIAAPTDTLKQACAMFVERMVVQDQSGQSRDTLSFASDGGTTRYSTPSFADGRPTGFLQVDALLNGMLNERPMVF